MKKFYLIILYLICLMPFDVFADRNTATIKGFTTSQLIKIGDAKVYSISFIATANNGNFAIHDVSKSDSGNSGDGSTTIKAEGQEATSGNSKYYDFSDKPLEVSTGLFLYINSGTAVIEYE